VVLDESRDQPLRFRASRRHVLDRVIASTVAARIWLLAGVELGVCGEAVLQVVDPHLDSLEVSYRAQMSRDLQAVLVCLVDRGTHFVLRNVRVRLE